MPLFNFIQSGYHNSLFAETKYKLRYANLLYQKNKVP
mgnify:CR=1 FL=1|jgi:hypothetical protein